MALERVWLEANPPKTPRKLVFFSFLKIFQRFSGEYPSLTLYLGILENGMGGAAAGSRGGFGPPFSFWGTPPGRPETITDAVPFV